MPILQGDLKILKSEIFTDNLNGGGAPTKTEVINGASNNMFEDVSTIDRVNGRVNLRKVFPSIESAANEVGLGCHSIIAQIPADTKQEVILTRADTYSRRPAMVSAIESYLNEGALQQLFVYGSVFAGSSLINLISNPRNANPEVGDVLILKSSTTVDYFAIADIETTLTTFIDGDGSEYQRNVHAIQTRQSVDNNYTGVSNFKTFEINPATKIYDAVVANSTQYYSSKKATAAILEDDATIEVSNVFGQLVPSSRVDEPIINKSVTDLKVKIGDAATINHNRTFTLSTTYTLGYPVSPNFLSIAGFTVSGDSILLGTEIIATIDFETGTFTKIGTSASYTFVCSLRVGATQGDSAESFAKEITINNRSTVYTFITPNFISAGTLTVRYRVLKKWYTLRDNGAGVLEGVGSGNIFYNTRVVSVSLSALPDVGSAIVINYANTVGIEPVDLTGYNPKLHFFKELTNNSFDISTLTITYTDTADTVRTITTNSQGLFAGAGNGYYTRETGIALAVPSFTPKATSNVVYTYGQRTQIVETFSAVARQVDGDLLITLGNTNIVPGTVSVEWDIDAAVTTSTPVVSGVKNSVLVPTGKVINANTLTDANARRDVGYSFGIADGSKSYKPTSIGVGSLQSTSDGRGYKQVY